MVEQGLLHTGGQGKDLIDRGSHLDIFLRVFKIISWYRNLLKTEAAVQGKIHCVGGTNLMVGGSPLQVNSLSLLINDVPIQKALQDGGH